MATAESLVADLQSYTEAGSTLPDANALECVNLAARKMFRRHDFRAMQASVDLAIAGGTVNWATLPFDFLHEVFVYTVDLSQSDPSKALTPVRRVLKPHWFLAFDPLVSTDPVFPAVASPGSRDPSTLQSRGYYVWAGQLVIVPSPSQAITVRLDYTMRLGDLVLGLSPQDQNPLTVEYPDVIRAGALSEAYSFLHEEGRSTAWHQMFTERLKDAVDADNAIAFAGPSPKRGT